MACGSLMVVGKGRYFVFWDCIDLSSFDAQKWTYGMIFAMNENSIWFYHFMLYVALWVILEVLNHGDSWAKNDNVKFQPTHEKF